MGSRNPMTFKERYIPFLKLCSFKWLLSLYIFFKNKKKTFLLKKRRFFFKYYFRIFFKGRERYIFRKNKICKEFERSFSKKREGFKKGNLKKKKRGFVFENNLWKGDKTLFLKKIIFFWKCMLKRFVLPKLIDLWQHY